MPSLRCLRADDLVPTAPTFHGTYEARGGLHGGREGGLARMVRDPGLSPAPRHCRNEEKATVSQERRQVPEYIHVVDERVPPTHHRCWHHSRPTMTSRRVHRRAASGRQHCYSLYWRSTRVEVAEQTRKPAAFQRTLPFR